MPPPLAEPECTPRVRHERLPTVDAGAVRQARIEVWAVRETPTGASADLAAVVLPARAGAPFRGASAMPPGSRFWQGPAAANLRATLQAAPPEQSQRLGAATALVGAAARTLVEATPGLRLELTPAGALTRLRIASAAATTAIDVPIDQPLAEGAGAALFVPVGNPAFAGHVVVVHCEAATGPDAQTRLEAILAAAPPEAQPPLEPVAWQLARQAIGADNRRQALLSLAHSLRVPRVVDLLLVADEATLIATAAGLPAFAEGDLAWPFERAAWLTLVPRLERDELTAAQRSALLRHLGAIAADAPTLRQSLQRATNSAGFAAMLQEENLAALGDRDPAHRVRAEDWLADRGVTLPGFDALGPAPARRAALRAFHAAALAPGPSR